MERVIRSGSFRVAGLAALVIALVALMVGASAAAAKFAPINRSGPNPAKHVSKKKLKASVTCSKGVRNAKRQPVLLFPATGVDSKNNFSWNYENLFDQQGIPWCASDQAGKRSTNMDDLWVRSYYVSYAIRKVHRMAGRKISVMGHSQGGMIMRIGLRFWPDTRRMVDDVIGFAGTNHGTDGGSSGSDCSTICTAGARQQASGSRFIKALNSRRETFKHVSYTEIFTSNDEIVTPQPKASSVAGKGKITNIGVQEICPADPSDHLQIGTSDAVGSALALDALGRRGPAKVSSIDSAVCSQPSMPGINMATVAADIATSTAQLVNSYATYPAVDAEPKVPCWTKRFPKACRRNRA